jgi:demethylmenaquinone methyltransferase/2-methoxy-6-polyprenyl-1,4-benzoquinol methylase
MLAGMPQTTWQAQVAYYRRRAAEYDLTSYGNVPRADRRIAALIGQLRPEGDVLEIACGTGIWTRHLAASARSLTALDPIRPGLAARRGPARTQGVTVSRIRGAGPNLVASSR